MKDDHEVQKASTRNPEKENPIICHSIEEGEENKKAKVFFLFLCMQETKSKQKKVQKYEAESKKEAEPKEKISSAAPE